MLNKKSDDEGGDEEDEEVKGGWLGYKDVDQLPLSLSLFHPPLVQRSMQSLCFLPRTAPPQETFTEEGGRVIAANCFSALSLSSRKKRAVAKKNMPPRTMTKGQSMRA